jgi:hypothetical protein
MPGTDELSDCGYVHVIGLAAHLKIFTANIYH